MKIAKLTSFKPSRVIYADKEFIVEYIQQNPLEQRLLAKTTFMHDGDKYIELFNFPDKKVVYGLITKNHQQKAQWNEKKPMAY